MSISDKDRVRERLRTPICLRRLALWWSYLRARRWQLRFFCGTQSILGRRVDLIGRQLIFALSQLLGEQHPRHRTLWPRQQAESRQAEATGRAEQVEPGRIDGQIYNAANRARVRVRARARVCAVSKSKPATSELSTGLKWGVSICPPEAKLS